MSYENDKFDRFRSLEGLSSDELIKRVQEAPEKCPILGFEKCNLYCYGVGVIYLTKPAYTAYTIPTWDKDDKSFSYYKIDLDESTVDDETIELDELTRRGWTIKELEELYGVKIMQH